jgi:hypothetical protein
VRATLSKLILNFLRAVSTCGSPSSALKALSARDKFKDVDVALADANKVATCGFDFKAIVEPDLHVPVLYCEHTHTQPEPNIANHLYLYLFGPLHAVLSQNHMCAGPEADALLRTLDLASFILEKPLDAEDARGLWRNIAWRKCTLNKAGGTAVDVGQGSGGLLLPPLAGSSGDGDQERVHFRIVRGHVRIGKRKNPGNPSGTGGSSVPG